MSNQLLTKKLLVGATLGCLLGITSALLLSSTLSRRLKNNLAQFFSERIKQNGLLILSRTNLKDRIKSDFDKGKTIRGIVGGIIQIDIHLGNVFICNGDTK